MGALFFSTTGILSIGESISGGTPSKVLHVGAGGVLAESAAFTFDVSSGAVTISANASASNAMLRIVGTTFTGGTSTTTKPTFLVEPSGTTSTGWSTAGTLIGANAATGFSGNLLDLQLNGATQISVSSNGSLSCNRVLFPSYSTASYIRFGGATVLVGPAANVIEQYNATNGQTFRVYNTYTDASNYERGTLNWVTNELFIGTESGGTGISRNCIIQSNANLRFRTSATNRWQIDTGGHFTAVADNTYDIGASGATRPRALYLAGGITHGSTTLLTTTVALTNGAGAAAGTIANAPSVGNPTKWIPINDNGTTRYIPAW